MGRLPPKLSLGHRARPLAPGLAHTPPGDDQHSHCEARPWLRVSFASDDNKNHWNRKEAPGPGSAAAAVLNVPAAERPRGRPDPRVNTRLHTEPGLPDWRGAPGTGFAGPSCAPSGTPILPTWRTIFVFTLPTTDF